MNMTEYKQAVLDHMAEKKLKFWVLKIEDFVEALTDEELLTFNKFLHKNALNREEKGKSLTNQYWVINKNDTPIDNLEDFLKAAKYKENEKEDNSLE